MSEAELGRGLLRLRAEDPEDVIGFSAVLQDAVVPVVDIGWFPDRNLFVMIANRFMHEAAPYTLDLASADGRGDGDEAGGPLYFRTHCGVRFHHVTSARRRALDLRDRGRFLELLALQYANGQGDSNLLLLHFAGGTSIELTVERITGVLEDFGEPWFTRARPVHRVEEFLRNG